MLNQPDEVFSPIRVDVELVARESTQRTDIGD
jgi:hypothetical protein